MLERLGEIAPFLTPERLADGLGALLLVIAGLILARLLTGVVRRLTEGRFEPQHGLLLRRTVYAVTLSLFVVSALQQLGVELGIFLGAAGILTVAVGFASQTSASNLVSGLFLIAERPFAPGDVIQVGTTTGEVLSIDLLAVKLRTFDNLFVRLPNEILIKTEVRNLTRFPIRRVDLAIGVAYGEDLDRVREVLYEVAYADPLCLDEPKPLFLITGYGDSAVTLQFSPWGLRQNYVELKNSMQIQIKRAFEAAGIEIPYPHRALLAGGGEAALPVRLAGPAEAGDKATRP